MAKGVEDTADTLEVYGCAAGGPVCDLQKEASVQAQLCGFGQGTRPFLVSSSNIGEMREQER